MNAFVSTLLYMSLAGGAVILLALVFRLIFKNGPKWIPLLLWAIVGTRLLCPIFIGSNLSFMPAAGEVESFIEKKTDKQPWQNDAQPSFTSVPVKEGDHTGAHFSEAASSTLSPVYESEKPIYSSAPIDAATTQKPQQPDPIAGERASSRHIAFFVWLGGAFAMTTYAGISYFKLRGKLLTAVRLEGNVYQSEFVKSPFLFGLRKPRVYVPFGLDENILSYVVSHEREHTAHSDQFWKLLGFFVLSVHWFNPLCWLSYSLFCRDLEIACDERVIKLMTDDQRAGYSKALLELSTGRGGIRACPLAFGEGDAKQRIKSVIRYKKPAVWASVCACLLVALFAVCAMSCRKQPIDPISAEVTSEQTPIGTPRETPVTTPEATANPSPTRSGLLEFYDPAFEQRVREYLGLEEGEELLPSMLTDFDTIVLSGEGIRSLKDMDKLKTVKHLILNHTPNIDFSELADIKTITKLTITNNTVPNIDFVSEMTWLKGFSFEGKGSCDLNPLANVPGIVNLGIGNCGEADLTPIKDMTLSSLSIWDTKIKNPSVIAGFKHLNYLFLSDCGLSDISFIEDMKGLTELSIPGNYVEDLSPIAKLSGLKYLDAENNRISDISPLFTQKKLENVLLSWNFVTSDDADMLLEFMETNPEAESPSVNAYPFNSDSFACWPLDLDGDGEDEYFYADLYLMEVDFVSYAWLENNEHRRLSDKLNCGTGHIAFGTYAYVISPEYGPCIMSISPEFMGEYYGYRLLALRGGKLLTVASEEFYNNDGTDDESAFDSAEAKAYEERVKSLLDTGYILVTTDRWGVMQGDLQEVTDGGNKKVENTNKTNAVICSYGSIGTGINNLLKSDYADEFVVVEGMLRYNLVVDPYSGGN